MRSNYRSIFVLGIFLLLIFSTTTFAIGNIYLDGMGALTKTTDARNQIGGGGALLYQVSNDFNFFIKTVFNKRDVASETTSGEDYYKEYKYIMSLAGIEYLYNINKLPLFWKNSVGIGAGSVSIKEDFDSFSRKYRTDKDETGLCVAAWTGLMYVFTQSICGYIDVGIHKSFFADELKDDNIMGMQILVGVRITLWGVNKSIYNEY